MKTHQAPKDRLFEVASRLFYQQGYRAVGVDTLAEEFGHRQDDAVPPLSFKGRPDRCVLQKSDKEFWGYFEQLTGEDFVTQRQAGGLL